MILEKKKERGEGEDIIILLFLKKWMRGDWHALSSQPAVSVLVPPSSQNIKCIINIPLEVYIIYIIIYIIIYNYIKHHLAPIDPRRLPTEPWRPPPLLETDPRRLLLPFGISGCCSSPSPRSNFPVVQ